MLRDKDTLKNIEHRFVISLYSAKHVYCAPVTTTLHQNLNSKLLKFEYLSKQIRKFFNTKICCDTPSTFVALR